MDPISAFLGVVTPLCFWGFLFYMSFIFARLEGGLWWKETCPLHPVGMYLCWCRLSTCFNDLLLARGRGHGYATPLWNSWNRTCQYNWHPLCQRISQELTSERYIITGHKFLLESKIELNKPNVHRDTDKSSSLGALLSISVPLGHPVHPVIKGPLKQGWMIYDISQVAIRQSGPLFVLQSDRLKCNFGEADCALRFSFLSWCFGLSLDSKVTLKLPKTLKRKNNNGHALCRLGVGINTNYRCPLWKKKFKQAKHWNLKGKQDEISDLWSQT